MNEKIRSGIDHLFKDMPKTRKTLELKEEIIANAQEKMMDLLSKGYRQEDAYEVVINSIGNVEELFQEMMPSAMTETEKIRLEAYQKKKAIFTAVSIGLYILAFSIFMSCVMMEESGVRIGNLDMTLFGLVIAAIICIAPTMLLIYIGSIAPKYQRKEDTMVEEYREWKMASQGDREIRKGISSVIWSLAVIAYFMLNMITGAWHVTWMVFLVAVCLESIVRLWLSIRKEKETKI